MRKPKILIVDDEVGHARLMTLMLKRMDRYQVMSELDSTLALQAVVKFKPHLVLLDWVMPNMDGEEVARQIRADSRVSETPILFLSAILRPSESREIAGFPAMAKPVEMHQLVEAIEEQLREVA
jgi:two-component system, OmpR family, alkaline phosphatase synthesis response regulator PhoP